MHYINCIKGLNIYLDVYSMAFLAAKPATARLVAMLRPRITGRTSSFIMLLKPNKAALPSEAAAIAPLRIFLSCLEQAF